MEQLPSGVFLTTTGREIFLSQLHLMHTYAGCLEGTPETNSPFLRRDIRNRVDSCLPNINALVVLDDGEKVLPDLLWIAKFSGWEAVHTNDPDYMSSLPVCWFSGGIPKDLIEALQAVIAKVDYEAHAEDYDMMP